MPSFLSVHLSFSARHRTIKRKLAGASSDKLSCYSRTRGNPLGNAERFNREPVVKTVFVNNRKTYRLALNRLNFFRHKPPLIFLRGNRKFANLARAYRFVVIGNPKIFINQTPSEDNRQRDN